MARKALLDTVCIEAFEYYYSLGKERTLRQVADKVGYSPDTVRYWSSKYRWAEKVAQRDADIRGMITPQMRYQFFINTLMDQVATAIESGELKIRTVEDLERVIKLDLFLCGEIPNTVIELPERIRDLLDAKIKELSK